MRTLTRTGKEITKKTPGDRSNHTGLRYRRTHKTRYNLYLGRYILATVTKGAQFTAEIRNPLPLALTYANPLAGRTYKARTMRSLMIEIQTDLNYAAEGLAQINTEEITMTSQFEEIPAGTFVTDLTTFRTTELPFICQPRLGYHPDFGQIYQIEGQLYAEVLE